MADEVLLTREGYEKLLAELEDLKAVKRKEVASKLKDAIAQGDLSENADYDAAKNEQAELEERITKLEGMKRKAKIIDETEVDDKIVSVGLKVNVKNLDTGEDESYTIVGSTEADPFEFKISNESPVGSALIGRKAGDKVVVEVMEGIVIHYEIKGISK